jgi:hypothetical protein
MNTTVVNEKPISQWTIAEQVAYLESLKQKGNSEKVTGVGEYLHAKMGQQVPTSSQTFTYYPRLDHNGNPEGSKMTRVTEVPDHMRDKGYTVVTAETDADFRRLQATSHFVPGEYFLTIHGVSLSFAMGSETTQRYDPTSKAYMVDVVAKNQNFLGRVRHVDPQRDTEEYYFWWMHPMNFDSPARMELPEQKNHGLVIRMHPQYYKEQFTKRIRGNVTTKKEHLETVGNADNMRLISELNGMTEKQLRPLAILTGISLSMDPLLPLLDQYKSHLLSVVTDQSGTLVAKDRRDRLMATMNRGDERVAEVVRLAIKEGVLILDGSELYVKDEEGNTSQPHMLDRFIVPEAVIPVWEQWFAVELSDRKATALVNHLDQVGTISSNNVILASGRGVEADKIAAVDKAIANGLVVANSKPNNWVVARTNQVICSWSGVNAEQKKKALLLLASSLSLPELLKELDIVRDDDSV